MIPLLLAACASSVESPETRALAEQVDAIVAAAGAGLVRVSCERQPQPASGPETFVRHGCLYRGSPQAIGTLLAHYKAESSGPGTHVSQSPCVRHRKEIGQLLPGSDDWFVKDGVETFRLAAPLPATAGATVASGDVHTLGEHVCIEIVTPR